MIPATGPVSLTDVLTELRTVNPGRALPISLGDADVRALAGIPSGPISLTDLRGKSSYTPMSGSVPDVADDTPINPSTNYTAHVTVAVVFSGGTAPFTYAWAKVSGDGTVTAANAASTSANFVVNRFSDSGEILVETVQCTVTDSTGATLVRQGTVTLTVT
jgi:hypothetical protein